MDTETEKLSEHILPAVLETDSRKQWRRIEELAHYSNVIHVDVADGTFVKTNTMKAFESLSRMGRRIQRPVRLELHLMVQQPARWFSVVRHIRNVKRIVLQVESEWEEALPKFKRYYRVGLAFKPETPLLLVKGKQGNSAPSSLKGGSFDFLLLLSVAPGAQGNPFRPEIYRKVREAKRLFPTLPLEIDGAMNPARIRKLHALGARDFVVGSYLKEGNAARRRALLRDF